MLSREVSQACTEYAEWVVDNRHQIPSWFPIDYAREAFEATYPFHPMVLSVFERKWQALPRFQQTRGILRLLALWVSRAYQEGFQGAHRDPLIGLGTAPLDDPLFRAAVFEQLGETRLEGAVTTDICGKKESHAIRLDNEAVDTIKKARLHRKAATAVFFESNGGQARTEATLPEVRLAVAEPGLDVGNVETVLETLGTSCYYLSVERNRYRFSLSPNLNKLLADRRASVQPSRINERMRSEIQKVFAGGLVVERVFFPDKSNQIPNLPALTLVVLAPEHSLQDPKTLSLVQSMTLEYGASSRQFKSALIWAIADTDVALKEEVRKLLAWEDIRDEAADLRLDDSQKQQLAENLKKAQRDLRECVWRSYKNLALLGKDNAIRVVDLGLVHSSATDNIVTFIINRLSQEGDIEKTISPNFLVRNWPPAFKEWSTKGVRDAFFASPQFPRLLSAEAVKETIARGVASGILAYVGKAGNGDYEPFSYEDGLNKNDIDISDDMFIITKEVAESYKTAKKTPPATEPSTGTHGQTAPTSTMPTTGKPEEPEGDTPHLFPKGTAEASSGLEAAKLTWTGQVPPQKWMNFYTKVLSKFTAGGGLKLTLSVEIAPEGGMSTQKIEETRVALRELGLNDQIQIDQH